MTSGFNVGTLNSLDVIVWDEQKRQLNLAKHEYDFADVTLEFFRDAVVLPARRDRMKATGLIGTKLVTVIFRRLGEQGVSIVSMRPASNTERRVK